MLNPGTQYATDRKLHLRQRLWDYATPPFDLVGWVLDLLDVQRGAAVLDVGCGNGRYLGPIRERGAFVVGCDRSRGMLQSAGEALVVAADVTSLPFAPETFDRLLAAHMLYHVEDRPAAVRELRRVLVGGGTCVVVTNGAVHAESIWSLVEQAVRRRKPGWNLSDAPIRGAFSLENGADQLRLAFDEVQVVRPFRPSKVVVRDPEVVTDYVASLEDLYERELSGPWDDVVDDVRSAVRNIIESEGAFTATSGAGAFVCR